MHRDPPSESPAAIVIATTAEEFRAAARAELREESRVAELKRLATKAHAYARAYRARRTLDAYAAHWAAFCSWCEAQGASSLPARAGIVALYLTSRAEQGRKVATLGLDLTAINHQHKLGGYDLPGAHPDVEHTMAGIRRTHGIAPKQKTPLLSTDLRRIATDLPNTLSGARDRALLLVGFSGAFRRSELVALNVADLQFDEDGLTVMLRRSKNDQEGAGRKVALPYGSSAKTCPVRATQAWLKRSSIADGALFRSVVNERVRANRLHAHDVARIVQRAVSRAGLNPAMYAGHSLRAGLATSAAKAGKSAHKIMEQTGHRSVAMVSSYIRDAELFKDNAAAGLL